MKASRRRSRDGISSVIGVAALILVFIVIVSFLIALFYRLTEFAQHASAVIRSRAEGEAILKSVSGWWAVNNSNLIINTTSRYSQALLVTTITVLFNDASKIVVSQYNETLRDAYVVLKKPGGEAMKSPLKLPIALSPGHTTLIIINISTNGSKEVLTATLTLSNPSTLVTLSLRNRNE